MDASAGDNLNMLVLLLMAKIVHPTGEVDTAIKTYVAGLPNTYGSYVGAYYAKYGDDPTDEINRMKDGISRLRWTPDVSPAYGAVRWYHRASSGGNPGLASMYEDIITKFIDNGEIRSTEDSEKLCPH
jgi:hypothetical protein